MHKTHKARTWAPHNCTIEACPHAAPKHKHNILGYGSYPQPPAFQASNLGKLAKPTVHARAVNRVGSVG